MERSEIEARRRPGVQPPEPWPPATGKSFGRPATPREAELLACLAEECAEVTQRCMKALRFGPERVPPGLGSTNLQRVGQEIGDLFGVVDLMCREGLLSYSDIRAVQAAKLEKLERFLRTRPEGGPGSV